MAQKIITLLEDDIDGGEAAETVSFSLDGSTYEIDLSDKNAAKLREELALYVSKGRKVAGASRRAKRASSPGTAPGEIRDWAVAQGLDIPARGRIPASVREAYYAAH